MRGLRSISEGDCGELWRQLCVEGDKGEGLKGKGCGGGGGGGGGREL